jgi:hypothetical protein
MANVNVIWDLDDDPEGNVAHIAEHGITKEEVEDVLNGDASFGASAHSGLPMAFGWTQTGRHLAVVFEEVEENPWVVRPVTAYEVPPPSGRKKGRGKRRG